MKVSVSPKSVAVLSLLLLFAPAFAHFIFQDAPQSPTPTASESPALASPSPTPTRSASPTPLPGAQNFHQWGSITVFNGLPSDSVRAIAQTPDGVMWFGTDNGLARFDGRRIQKFSLGESETNGVLALKTSSIGELWVGTRAGAFVYSGNRFKTVARTENLGITAILLSHEVFLGTDSGTVLQVSSDPDGTFSSNAILADPIRTSDEAPARITGLIERSGELFASTDGRGVFRIHDRRVDELPIRLRNSVVNAMASEPSDESAFWIGTDAPKSVSGIFVYNGEDTPARIAAPTADVYSLEINKSEVWVGTERFGLFQFTNSKIKKNYTFENTSGGLRSNMIYALFTDREGVLWIGTNRGVSRFDRLGARQETVSSVANSNFIRTLFRSIEGQVIAGSNRGLFRFDKETWNQLPHFENKVIYAIAAQKNGSILVGTSVGLFDLTGRQLLSGDVRDLASFQSRTIAAVFGRGVIQISTFSAQAQTISSDETTTSIYAGADRLWIGTAGRGLFSFDGKSAKQEVTPESLKSGTIWKMTSATDGSLWIAGQNGVFRLVNDQPETIVEAEDVRDIYIDGDHFWAATTTRGLIQGRNDPRFGWLSASVGFEQGLPSEKSFSILPLDEKLLIATNRGIVTYIPSTVAPKIIPTRILSQRVHDLAELAAPIALEYPQNSLLVEVAGQSSRTFPEEFQYAFVLKNAKGEEIARQLSNDPQYAPSDLASGNYTIESTAFNRDLVASEPLVVAFSVAKAPFPWMATALAILLSIAIVGLVWAAFEHRRIKQRNRELAAARFDLANEAERERSRIARDLHDQTLADLRNLMMRSDKGSLASSELRSEIESVSTEIRRICEDLSPSVLENVGLVPALEFLLSQSVDDHKFLAEDGIEDRVQFPLNVQLQIYRIAQEVLANIRRHSNADSVEMKVASADGHFVLTITDNGRAFQPNTSAGKGRGIANIRSRANLVGGRVSWKERSKGGNTFLLRIPRK